MALFGSKESPDRMEVRVANRDPSHASVRMFGSGAGDDTEATWIPALLADAAITNLANDPLEGARFDQLWGAIATPF